MQYLQVSLILRNSSDPRERRAFEYYFHRVGPALAGALDLNFWSGSVLQICQLEPAVWDAVISLSVLYERPPICDAKPLSLLNNPADVRHGYHEEALVWYSRSLAALQRRINQGVADLTISMISCVLFIAIELLQGNKSAAVILYTNGARLLASTMASARGSELLMTTIVPIFRRLGTQFLISTDGTLSDALPQDRTIQEVAFVTISEARNELLGLIAEWKVFNKDIKAQIAAANEEIPDLSALEMRQESLEERLHIWYACLTPLMPKQNTNLYPAADDVDGLMSLLLMTHISILIETKTSLISNEMAYDAYESDFAQILEYAPKATNATHNLDGSQPYFMFEMGVFLPLFITALKCRFPNLRRRALMFLQVAPPVQGLCMCSPVVQIISILVFLEEYPGAILPGAGTIEELLAGSGRIPASQHRIRTFDVSSDANGEGKMKNKLKYSVYASGSSGKNLLVENEVLLPVLMGT
ncbi:transcriptional regulator family: Fungal Specific TF [Penicillium antarcticum]|uniref:transcriptional regulator family: Fungal Specific TF n=1 Tax=Penicillium antarcticum TaxID=416450 RepID=UPI002398199F|nr:transcriptional regulator family: Fungal Specific TF [Penicillium antarcticum]KAJ5312141.1 transcriptional regulator family: Fungal Specific TF [Penicillium antarcticum]